MVLYVLNIKYLLLIFLLFLMVKKNNNNDKITKKNNKNVAKPEIYTYNANHLIPVFSTTIPGNHRYLYPVPGKIRAVLNTGIQYREKSELYSIPVFSTRKNQSRTKYRYSIPGKKLSGIEYRYSIYCNFFERYRSLK
jgi:hypothetical protein